MTAVFEKSRSNLAGYLRRQTLLNPIQLMTAVFAKSRANHSLRRQTLLNPIQLMTAACLQVISDAPRDFHHDRRSSESQTQHIMSSDICFSSGHQRCTPRFLPRQTFKSQTQTRHAVRHMLFSHKIHTRCHTSTPRRRWRQIDLPQRRCPTPRIRWPAHCTAAACSSRLSAQTSRQRGLDGHSGVDTPHSVASTPLTMHDILIHVPKPLHHPHM